MIETVLDIVAQRPLLYHIFHQVQPVSPSRHPGCIRVSLLCIWNGGVFLTSISSQNF